MNIAIITAGGVGSRMKLSVPKQFYEVFGKPLIVYTLEAFQNSEDIDEILIVYLEGYLDYFRELVTKYHLTKVKYFAQGGETNQMSIENGVKALRNIANNDDVIVVHDGIRPLVSNEVISDCIKTCLLNGNAIAVIPSNEAMLYSEDKTTSTQSINRDFVWKTQTPHAIRYKDLEDLLAKVREKGVTNSVAICTMLIENNIPVNFSKGSNDNFKITNPEDLQLFKAFLSYKTNKE